MAACCAALCEVASKAIQDGSIVRLGDMGSLRLTLSSEGRDKKEDVNASVIRGRCNYPFEKLYLSF